jgi:hypothetical protein
MRQNDMNVEHLKGESGNGEEVDRYHAGEMMAQESLPVLGELFEEQVSPGPKPGNYQTQRTRVSQPIMRFRIRGNGQEAQRCRRYRVVANNTSRGAPNRAR